MKTIKQLLGNTPRTPLAVPPTETVLKALQIMAEKDIGALLVMEGTRLAGIFSERDYARKVFLQGKSSNDTPVSAVMTDKVVYAEPDQTVDEAMALMTDKHVRHLPVLENGTTVIGVISIGDLVKETISHQAFMIKQLEHYIAS
jgi:CBS domain-containing protein